VTILLVVLAVFAVVGLVLAWALARAAAISDRLAEETRR
jgi:hypothetical protein